MSESKYGVNWDLSLVKEHEVKRWVIYLHYAPEDGRVYIGRTSQKPIEKRFSNGARLREDGGYRGRFREYLTTHPLEDMIHVVLDTTDDDLEAKRLEEAYIELFCSTDPKYGFNSQVGDIPSEKYHEAVKKSWAEGGASREARCIYQYTILHPNGELTETDNLNSFCKKYGTKQGNMVSRGYSKGYRVLRKELKQ